MDGQKDNPEKKSHQKSSFAAQQYMVGEQSNEMDD